MRLSRVITASVAIVAALICLTPLLFSMERVMREGGPCDDLLVSFLIGVPLCITGVSVGISLLCRMRS